MVPKKRRPYLVNTADREVIKDTVEKLNKNGKVLVSGSLPPLVQHKRLFSTVLARTIDQYHLPSVLSIIAGAVFLSRRNNTTQDNIAAALSAIGTPMYAPVATTD